MFRIFVYFLIASCFVCFAYAAPKSSYIAVDEKTGTILFSKNADKTRYPASLTKLMTLYILFEELEARNISLDDEIPFSRTASNQIPSKLGIRPGESISVETAIKAIIVRSANDVAYAVAEYIANGSEPRFVDRMNLTARKLGMLNTNFVNPNGLHSNKQYSTAYDLAVLAISLYYHFPQYYHYFSYSQLSWNLVNLDSTNSLIGVVAGVDGLKTGYTSRAGYNIINSAGRKDKRVLVVVIGELTSRIRDLKSRDMIEQSFNMINDKKYQKSKSNLVRINYKRYLNPSQSNPVDESVEPPVDSDPSNQLIYGAYNTIGSSKNIKINTNTKPNSLPKSVFQKPATSSKKISLQYKSKPSMVTIQIGAFKNKDKATYALNQAIKSNASLFKNANSSVIYDKPFYKARISNLMSEQAVNACKVIKACYIIK